MSALTSAAPHVGGDCQIVRFISTDYPPCKRLEALREAYGRTLQKLDIEPLSTEQFHAEATLRRMPGLAMITGHRSAAIYRRPREVIDHDDVGITVGLTSGCEAQQLGRTCSLNRGDAIVMTGAEPASLKVPGYGKYISIRVPVHSMSALVAKLDAVYGRPIPADTPALQLLVRYIGILEETEGFAMPDVRFHAVTYIHDLAALALGATPDAAEAAKTRGVRVALLCAIKEDIANRLGEPGLSLAALAMRHGLMPRSVQRLFKTEGTTFSDYLLEQRLALAHRLLSDPRRAAFKISAVASDAGFSDLSYFNRTFRRRYSMAPSEWRAAAAARL